jgi:hypothetical protein
MIYVNTTGSDTTGDGSINNPYLTLQYALTVFETGTINVTGVHNVNETITINKNVIIDGSSASFISSVKLFILQNTVTFNNLTLKSDDIVIESNVACVINTCTIEYSTRALILNGVVNITNCTFNRLSGLGSNSIIDIYGVSSLTITGNTFNDSGNVQNILYFTETEKNGTLGITNNTVNYAGTANTKFIYFDYFNDYSNSNITLNTKIKLNVSGNTLNFNKKSGNIVYLDIIDNNSLYMFDVSTINNNTINNTRHGTLHIGKKINNNTITIDNNTLTRNVFKIYSNTLNTIPEPELVVHIDAMVGSFLDASGVQCTNNSKIATINVLGTSNMSFIQTVDGDRPTYITNEPITNKPSLYFTNSHMRSSYNLNSQIFTSIFVFNSIVNITPIWDLNDGLTGGDWRDFNQIFPIYGTLGVIVADGSGHAWKYYDTIVLNTNSFYIFVYVAGDNAIKTKIYKNNTKLHDLILTRVSKGLTFGGLGLGARRAIGESLNGYISELMFYTGELDDSDIEDLVAGLHNKWQV